MHITQLFKRDGPKCPLTGASFDPRDPNGCTPYLTQIISNAVHDKVSHPSLFFYSLKLFDWLNACSLRPWNSSPCWLGHKCGTSSKKISMISEISLPYRAMRQWHSAISGGRSRPKKMSLMARYEYAAIITDWVVLISGLFQGHLHIQEVRRQGFTWPRLHQIERRGRNTVRTRRREGLRRIPSRTDSRAVQSAL